MGTGTSLCRGRGCFGSMRLIEQYGYVIAAHHKAGQPKISGPEKEILEKLPGFCDLLLVEADGSRRRPLKVPAVHEPVIPSFADMVVGVIGLDCIGKGSVIRHTVRMMWRDFWESVQMSL